ncbi:hypothetical protein GCM10022397_47880 [Flavivirga jejuensis]
MFPGQGSQYKGMGKDLFGKYPYETKLASDILGYDIEELCVNDPNRQLVKTQYTQPAIYVVNSFLYREHNQVPDYLIGHSLGEYNALLESGAFDFETGLRLVQKRGELMSEVSGGGMAAVLGVDIKDVKRKLAADVYEHLSIANYNTPTQTVISGTEADIKAVVKDFTAQGITIIPLFVSAAFHSPYMELAEKEFSHFISNFNFNELKIPVIANVTGRPYENHLIVDLLSNQISRSVCWSDSIRYLMGQDVSEFQEVGKVMLTKMTTEICNSCSPIKEGIR